MVPYSYKCLGAGGFSGQFGEDVDRQHEANGTRVMPRPGARGGPEISPAGWATVSVVQYDQVSNTITVRLPEDLAEWLNQTAHRTGIPKGRIIRAELEKLRNSEPRPFLRWAGAVSGPRDLSSRRGFSRK